MRAGIAIVTITGDAHAYLVASKLRSERREKCHVFEIDRISNDQSLTAKVGDAPLQFILTDAFGDRVDLKEISVCWWRRIARRQSVSKELSNEDLQTVVNSSCFDGVVGAFLTGFTGSFISDPIRTSLGENKIIQLQAAQKIGFRIPKTLISNSTAEVLEFCSTLPGQKVVAKALGHTRKLTDARILHSDELNHAEVALVPTIFQEYITGRRHVRVNIFGDRIIAVDIYSDKVDWRRELPERLAVSPVPPLLERQLIKLTKHLGLEMGVVDLKIAENGDVVFLEINPQGQFLFLEPLTGVPFTDIFVDFLLANVATLGDENGHHCLENAPPL
jgi:hypothetical protein